MSPGPRRGAIVLPALMVVVGLAIGLVAAVLSGSGDDEHSAQRVVSPRGPDDAMISRVRSSAVLITAFGCRLENVGAGVVLDAGIITNAHVVAGADEATVTTVDGETHVAEVRSFDPLLDLALLVSPGVDQQPLGTAAASGGTGAVALVRSDGEVEAQAVSIVRTINIRSADIYGAGRYERRGLELAASIDPGDSGGAIVDGAGEVVGIVFSASRRQSDVAYAVSALEIDSVVASASDGPVDTGDCLR